MSKHIQGIVVKKTPNMYSANASFVGESENDGKKSPTMISTVMAAMIISTAVLTTALETCRKNPKYRSFVSGSHVSVGISRKSMYRRNIASRRNSGAPSEEETEKVLQMRPEIL
jgi:hypothetical protein